MNWTIKNKLSAAFGAVSFLVLVAGVIGIAMINSIANSTRVVIDEKLPQTTVSLQAITLLQESLLQAQSYLDQHDPESLKKISKGFHESLDDFNMMVSMLRFGTESEEFKSSAAGGMYIKDEMDLIVPQPDLEMLEVAEKVAVEFERFVAASDQLIETHQKKAVYEFVHQGSLYDIKGFLYFIFNERSQWNNSLEEAAKFGIEFNGVSEEAKGEFGIWYSNFKTSDKKLGKLLKEYNKLNTKVHGEARKINALAANKKPTYFKRIKARLLNKISKQLVKIQKYVVPLLNELDLQEKESVQNLESSKETLTGLLDQLRDTINRQVDSAKNETANVESFSLGLLVAVMIVALAIAIVLGLLITKNIAGPVNVLAKMIHDLRETGDFSMRATVASRDETGQMMNEVNKLMDDLQATIGEANSVVSDIANGEYSSRIQTDCKGDLATLKQAVNHSAGSVQSTMGMLNDVMRAIIDGNFSYRLDNSKMKGEFGDTLTETMETMERVITDINQVMLAVSQANFNERVTAEASGDLDILKQNINTSMDTLSVAIDEVVEVSNLIGDGNLSRSITKNYSGSIGLLKDGVNNIQKNLSSIVSQVNTISQSVLHGSNEISSGVDDLANRTSQQAASLEQTAATVEEFSSSIADTAINAGKASELSNECLDRAIQGSKVVEDTASKMQDISKSSVDILEIITLIDEIAFQTNLLALNASVEAARAGEHGRGFSVVAGEVRILAQRTAGAAGDIKNMIETSVSSIQDGTSMVSQSGDALVAIQDSVKKVNDLAKEIATATQEQSLGIQQVKHSVTDIDVSTQQNASLVQESAAASAELSGQADEMSKMVGIFKL